MQTQELNGIEADLEELLTNNHLEPSKLSTFQRIIFSHFLYFNLDNRYKYFT